MTLEKMQALTAQGLYHRNALLLQNHNGKIMSQNKHGVKKYILAC